MDMAQLNILLGHRRLLVDTLKEFGHGAWHGAWPGGVPTFFGLAWN